MKVNLESYINTMWINNFKVKNKWNFWKPYDKEKYISKKIDEKRIAKDFENNTMEEMYKNFWNDLLSDKWLDAYKNFISGIILFPQYSLKNSYLIWLQMNDRNLIISEANSLKKWHNSWSVLTYPEWKKLWYKIKNWEYENPIRIRVPTPRYFEMKWSVDDDTYKKITKLKKELRETVDINNLKWFDISSVFDSSTILQLKDDIKNIFKDTTFTNMKTGKEEVSNNEVVSFLLFSKYNKTKKEYKLIESNWTYYPMVWKVFDISQVEKWKDNENEENTHKLEDKTKQIQSIFKNQETYEGIKKIISWFKIKIEEWSMGINHHWQARKMWDDSMEISINNWDNIEKQIDTLLHEWWHILLWHFDKRKDLDKHIKEFEAETVSYLFNKKLFWISDDDSLWYIYQHLEAFNLNNLWTDKDIIIKESMNNILWVIDKIKLDKKNK